MAERRRPSRLTIVDVETTGLAREDRVVSLAAIHIDDVGALATGGLEARIDYLIFNPGRASHPRARAVHGYSDEFLAMQDPFSEHAQKLHQAMRHDGLIVAHNASFDKRFILNEFKTAGLPLSDADFFCTMMHHRQAFGSPSGLDAVIRQIGYPSRKDQHNALHDAWLALVVFCWEHDLPIPDPKSIPTAEPLNIRKTPRPVAPATAARSLPPAMPTPAPTPSALPSLYEQAMLRVGPLATIMMAVANADGQVFEAEVESLSLLIDTTLSGTELGRSDDLGAALLERLVAMQPGETEIDAACDAIVRDTHMQNAVSGWVRQITFADGDASERESRAILWIAERMKAARLRQRGNQSH